MFPRPAHFAPIFLMLTASAATAQSAPAPPVKPLGLEGRTSLRCAAAFAIVDAGQKVGDTQALTYPLMAQRGREFFVRVSAKVMDDTGMNRVQVAEALTAEAAQLRRERAIDQVMPACLLLLDASGI